ncbi:MAG: lysophospholipid acyltransferase family protein [Phycisphaerales bacterium]|nr:lysophospholipid acyltransferase family protein [Phycisphaerales bacterium]
MPWYAITGIVFGALLILVTLAYHWLIPWLRRTPGESVFYGALFRFGEAFFWLIHRYKGYGLEYRPDTRNPGKLIVACNHSGSIDPFLVQFVCPFHIRWITSVRGVPRLFRPLVNYLGSLNLNSRGQDTHGLRQAMTHLNAGKVLGIFPEGKIAVPPQEIGPFAHGIGYLVSKTDAPVLLVWISGTPDTNQVLPSLLRPSHSSITFIDYIKFETGMHKSQISDQLRERLHQASGWPLRDHVQEPDRMET